MPRLMSVSHTEAAVIERRKTVTRRLGWWKTKRGRRILTFGDQITLCRKVMGRKSDEPLVKLAEVEVVDVRREMLWEITAADIVAEGVDHLIGTDAITWIDWFCATMGVPRDIEVTRIEWKYLP